jgi:hypothetical protein
MLATPMAYLIDEAGVIAHDVAVGTDAIRDLMCRVNGLVRAHLDTATHRRGGPAVAQVA